MISSAAGSEGAKGVASRLTVRRARLALAVIAVIVAGQEWLFFVHGVRDSLAQTVTLEHHIDGNCSSELLRNICLQFSRLSWTCVLSMTEIGRWGHARLA